MCLTVGGVCVVLTVVVRPRVLLPPAVGKCCGSMPAEHQWSEVVVGVPGGTMWTGNCIPLINPWCMLTGASISNIRGHVTCRGKTQLHCKWKLAFFTMT